jgi:tagatose-1,6-bisphosphate aldolase non-catalytic subunit AgaZ/GatZ
MSEGFDRSPARKAATERREPMTQLILRALDRVSERHQRSITLLAVNPNSLSVLKSALRSAKRYNAPIILTCTMNQVDLDGGYTTWTQFDFVKLVREEARKVEFDGPIIIASDHYGPWLKDEHARKGLSFDETMDGVKRSLEACLEAGFDYLHIDATMCPGFSGAARMSKVVERTLELIEYTEGLRKDKGLPRISYEVGTEEVAGGLSEPELISVFLAELREKMSAKGLEDAWPSMLVGNIGTNLHTTTFNFEGAKTLYRISSGYGLHLKSHYTDYVTRLQDYPKVPIRAANVGPRFTNAEFDTLQRLAGVEAELMRKAGEGPQEPSHMSEILVKAVVDSGRWKKWLLESETGKDFSQLQKDRQLWLLRTGSRYIWMTAAVVATREELYNNLGVRGIDAEVEVLRGIDTAMDEFFIPFNLRDSRPAITAELGLQVDTPKGDAR